MVDHRSGCLVCSKELIYLEENKKLSCHYCGKIYDANAMCLDGHFICDSCHRLPANEVIHQTCINSSESDPVKIAMSLMHNHALNMHGPEHHFLVPAVLIASYYNVKQEFRAKTRELKKARIRAEQVPGGFCGFQGCCGAGVGTGIFLSLITQTTPYSGKNWGTVNDMTSKALSSISKFGGPRCCKRTTFLALLETVNYLNTNFNVQIPMKKEILCDFTKMNDECLKEACPFYND